METIYLDYAPLGVQFFYIYKHLQHPELDGYIEPFTLEERLMHIQEAKRTLGSALPWIADSMSNDLKHALGNSPNSEFVIDPEGRVVIRRAWSRPEQLRQDLEGLVGAVDHPTLISDLNLKMEPPPRVAASGVVPRVKIPGVMMAMKVTPEKSDIPFYAKLRAEVTRDFLGTGKGILYLGFNVDPIYRVHWNNLVDPLKFEIKTPQGMTVSPTQGEGPELEVASDIDPREFLLDVTRLEGVTEPLQLAVRYYACNDDEGWCIPVTQNYLIHLESYRDGGIAPRRSWSVWNDR
ncbi:MAG: hypothetical protein V3R94_08820 [Acidobacteriota bacterium]